MADNPANQLPLLDPATLRPALNPILVVDGKGLDEVKRFLAEPRTLAHDYEYNIVDGFYRRRARTLQLGNKDVQYIIDFLAFADGDTKKLIHGQGGFRRENSHLHLPGGLLRMYTEDQSSFEEAPVNIKTFQPIYDVLEPSFNSDSHLKIAHFAEAEYVTSKWCLGIRTWNIWDTFLAERVLTNGDIPAFQPDYWGLDDFVARYFKRQLSKAAQTTFDLHSPLSDEQIIYCALDIRSPWQIMLQQEPKIKEARLLWTAKIENDALPAFGDMHINGLFVNPEKWQAIIDKNTAELVKAYEAADEFFVPLVGEKELPDPERVEVADAAWKVIRDNPSEEELAVNEQIKTTKLTIAEEIKAAKKAKDLALADHLTFQKGIMVWALGQKRDILQAEREKKKDAAKAYYKSISYLATKGHAEDIAKMKGKARLNYNSGPQVKAALLAGPWGLTEKDLPDLDAKTTLLALIKTVPAVAAYVTIKKIEKKLGTYGYRWITARDQTAQNTKDKDGYVDPDTGRIHPPFQQHGTDTGRPSCKDPNVLNLPKEPEYRESFEAREGRNNVTKDCAGQELRILVQISREETWITAFNREEDVHSISTHMVRPKLWEEGTRHKPWNDIDKKTGELKIIPACAYFYSPDGLRRKCKCPKHEEMRAKFKAVNFGIAYDKQAYSLSIELGIPEDEAQSILDGWKATFKTTQAALEELRNSSYARGEARTLGGRRRFIRRVTPEQAKNKLREDYPDRKHFGQQSISNMIERLVAARKREGGNMPIQGTGADLMKLAMGCGFDPEGNPYLWHILEPVFDSLLENYVYDEFMAETPLEHCEAVGGPKGVGGVISDAIIRAGAQFVTVVPMASEGAIAKSWTK